LQEIPPLIEQNSADVIWEKKYEMAKRKRGKCKRKKGIEKGKERGKEKFLKWQVKG
jgi:hypothetical protein